MLCISLLCTTGAVSYTHLDVYKRQVISYSKDLGLVNEVFNDKIITDLVGEIAISHVRYSTCLLYTSRCV